MRAVLLVVVLVALSQTALAEERVLYCTETDSTGFKWEAGQTEGQNTDFKKDRYIVEVLSEEKRTFTQTTGDVTGVTVTLACRKAYPAQEPDLLTCNTPCGMEPWLFQGNTFVYAFLYGTPVGGDPNIIISYGTCTEF